MAAASRVTLEIRAADVPVFEGVASIATRNRSGGLASNQDYFGAGVEIGGAVPPAFVPILFDPQTSGGLLISIADAGADQLMGAFAAAGVRVWRIGGVVAGAGDTRVRVI
jgi:selenide,water dikinase